MANLADLLVHVGIDAADLEGTMGNISSTIDDNIGKITALGAAGGAAMEGFARSQGDTNYALERMGRVTGEGSQAMRDMAGELQNVTFPMSDVTALMETATQRGLEGEGIADYANFWDMVGDATGEAGPELGKAGTALGLVGIAAGEEAEALDAFGFITDNTTGSISDFLRFTERAGKELGDNTPNVNDMAAALGALEGKGFGAQVAQRELQQALRESDGDMDAALESLGIAGPAYDEMRTQVEGAGSAITANAQAFRDTLTPMQSMQAHAENLMTKYGDLAGVASTLAVPMLALGPMAKGVSLGFSAITSGIPKLVSGIGSATAAIWTKIAALGSWAAATVAQGARAVASMAVAAGQFVAKYAMMAAQAMANAVRMAASWIVAMGPVGWVIAAVVALVALIIANWDKVADFTKAAWNKITGWISDNADKIKKVVEVLGRIVLATMTGGMSEVVIAVVKNWDKIKAMFAAGRDRVVGLVTDLRDRVVGFFGGLRDKVVGFVTDLKDKVIAKVLELKDGAIEKFEDLLAWVRELPGKILGGLGDLGKMLKDAGRQILQGLWDGMTEIWDNLTGWVGGLGSKIADLKGPIEKDRKLLTGEGMAIMEGLGKGLASGWADNEKMLAGMAGQMQGTFGVRLPGVSALGTVGGDGATAGELGRKRMESDIHAMRKAMESQARQPLVTAMGRFEHLNG